MKWEKVPVRFVSVVVEAVNWSALCIEEHYKRGTLRGFDGVYLTPQEGFPGIIAQ